MFSFLRSKKSLPRDAKIAPETMAAILSALPFAYFGKAGDSILTSASLPKLLSKNRIASFADLLSAIHPQSAAMLESGWIALCDGGEDFTMHVKSFDGVRTLLVHGVLSNPIAESRFPILWWHDETALHDANAILQANDHQKGQMIERLVAGLDTMDTAIWLANSLSDVAWCNNAYATLISKTRDEILNGQLLPDLTKPNKNERDVIAGLLKDVRRDGARIDCVGRRITGGQRRMYRLLISPASGTKDLYVCSLTDITELEDCRREITRVTDAQGKLLENLQSAIAVFGADQKLTYYNQAFAKMWGVEDSYLNTKPKLGEFLEKLRELRRLPEQSDFRAYKRNWLDWFTALLHSHEEMLYLPNGNAVRLVVSPHPLGGLMLSFDDVTSNLALETSYNTLMAIQRETLDALAEGVAVFGSDGRIRLWNQSLYTLLSVQPEQLGKFPHIIELKDHINRHFIGLPGEDIGLRIQGLVLSRSEERLDLRHNNEPRMLTVSCIGLPDGGAMLTWSDVTDRTLAEQALRDRANALEEAERVKSEFLANVSYQFRTPLNAMMGFAEILHQGLFGQLTDKQRGYTQNIVEAGHHLASLIDDILDLTGLEAGQITLNVAPVNMDALLEAIAAIARDWAGHKGVGFSTKLDGALGSIDGDDRRIKQILVTLLRQSIGRCAKGHTITVETKALDTCVCVKIRDTGPEIAPDMLKQVFAPFEVINNRNSNGLGLALSKGLADAMGGRLDAQSADGATCFTLHLPRRAEGDR